MIGVSGFLAAACATAAITGDSGALDRMGGFARALMASPPLPDADAGLAHGKTGVGFALMRWGQSARDRECCATGLKLLAADARIASRARATQAADASAAMLAWCRGELGTAWAELTHGRSRYAARVVENLRLHKTVIAAMCPCHGLLGQVEFLLDAARAGVPGARQALRTRSRAALGRLISGEACSDHSHTIETPGLLMGLAGSGYTLLRLADPERTPTLLMLQA